MLNRLIRRTIVTGVLLAGVGSPTAWAQGDLMIYPKAGQSPQQQQQDRYHCHTWAVQQSGFDPSNPQAQASIAGDAGKGAAIGAIAGGMGRAFKERDRQMQSAPASPPGRDNYNRAMASCLEALGYSVK
ncbi:hypothetical protein [Methylohalobius crimeensis]|uniref:hypothetical protein n=1 Tax=Methylohalobius crimeensis TaxID=244365 RepID=UPI000479FAE8|nr:hypothetical protein [Methylohalobius crimeensis]